MMTRSNKWMSLATLVALLGTTTALSGCTQDDLIKMISGLVSGQSENGQSSLDDESSYSADESFGESTCVE